MTKNNRTLCITSINPYKKLEHQIRCFAAWENVGCDILTFNNREESELLISHGISRKKIVMLNENETAKFLFGKTSPRILPIINRAKEYDYDSFIITNSDIYPSCSRNVSSFLSSINSAIALTRNECAYIDDNTFVDSLPYRGGLDIFYFKKDALIKTFKYLFSNPMSERMTYGVPGWDYFLATHIIRDNNGVIMDGEIFLHESHETSYSNSNELSNYIDYMLKQRVITHNDPIHAAHEFKQLITNNCVNNKQASLTLKNIYYVKKAKKSKAAINPYNYELNELNEPLNRLGVHSKYRKEKFKRLITAREHCDWQTMETFMKLNMRGMSPLSQHLIYILATIIKRRPKLKLIKKYCENNKHPLLVKNILKNTHGDSQTIYIARLFLDELLLYGIYNSNLLKYITLSTKENYQVELCEEIMKACKGFVKNENA